MTVRPRLRLPSQLDGALLAGGAAAVAVLLGLLIPWLSANPPAGLTASNAPYTDEGMYSAAARNLALFGSFGSGGRFSQLVNPGYTLASTGIFSIAGPSIQAARFLSVLAVCATVLLALWGLAGPLGRMAAGFVAAGLGGSQLILLYGHVAFVDPFELMLVMGGFVALMHALSSQRVWLGVLSGVLLAGAAGSKANALLVLPGIIGVPAARAAYVAVKTRDRRSLRVPAAAVGAFLAVGVIWLVAVALPNWSEFSVGWNSLEDVSWASYPHSPGGIVTRLWGWLVYASVNDHVPAWSAPLLIAAVIGTATTVAFWRICRPVDKQVTISGWTWAIVGWLPTALSTYSPNRFFLVFLPGLALAGAPGLAMGVRWLADRVAWPAGGGVAATAVILALAVPGISSYLTIEAPVSGTDQLSRDQAELAALLPRNAVLYGVYAPEMALPAHVGVVIPWPSSGLHMRDPVGRFGVDYVIADVAGTRDSADVATVWAVADVAGPLGRPLVVLPWGPHRLAVYPVPAGGTYTAAASSRP